VLKGASTLFYKKHVVELHELSPEDAAAFMHDIQKVSRAIQQATGAIKINYEIHGNTIPHLHMHFFPRYRGDIFENQPINPRVVTTPVFLPGEFAEFVAKVQAALK
jgi:diadenosine tetraphosphate (Ap4A) HIT family hydrolase